MPKLDLIRPGNGEYKVLCLGAHSDDIEIGCGGTILKIAATHPSAQFYWVVFSADKHRAIEAKKSFERFVSRAASRKKLLIQNFKESFFPHNGAVIKNFFGKLAGIVSPDLILTHYRDDRHQDHRVISDLTWNTFRSGHLILEYEIPKYDGDLGIPNLFVEFDREIVQRKIDYLMTGFSSQKSRQWFDEETFLSTLRLRGIECNSRTKYAEAFHCRKMVLD